MFHKYLLVMKYDITGKLKNKLDRILDKELKNSNIYNHHDELIVYDPNTKQTYFLYNKNGVLIFNKLFFENLFKYFSIEDFSNYLAEFFFEKTETIVYDVDSLKFTSSWDWYMDKVIDTCPSHKFIQSTTKNNLSESVNEIVEKKVIKFLDNLFEGSRILPYYSSFFLMNKDNQNPKYHFEYSSEDKNSREYWVWFNPDSFSGLMNVLDFDVNTFEKILKKWFSSKFSVKVVECAAGSGNDSTTERLLKRVLKKNKLIEEHINESENDSDMKISKIVLKQLNKIIPEMESVKKNTLVVFLNRKEKEYYFIYEPSDGYTFYNKKFFQSFFKYFDIDNEKIIEMFLKKWIESSTNLKVSDMSSIINSYETIMSQIEN